MLGLAALLLTAPVRAQSYGLEDQVLTIGSSQFRGVEGSPSQVHFDFYLYNDVEGSYWYYLAPLSLPEGALIERVCLFARDSDSGYLTYVSAYLYANKLVPIGGNPASMQVTMTYPNLPFFFGRVLGKDTFAMTASCTAMFQPRDIMVVLDFSASMNDDSTLAAIGKLDRSVVEGSLLNCWNDLGPPTFGNLGFTPNWVTVPGDPPISTSDSFITVKYRRTARRWAATLAHAPNRSSKREAVSSNARTAAGRSARGRGSDSLITRVRSPRR